MLEKIVTPGGKPSAQASAYIVELCAKSLRPDEVEWEGNFHADRGNELEDEAREVFEKATGSAVDQVGFVLRDDPGISGCSPDGLIRGTDGEYVAGLESTLR